MYLKVEKTEQLTGQTIPPNSKSHNIRALFIALLAQGQSTLKNFLQAGDTQDAIRLCQGLDATITQQDDKLIIKIDACD